MASGNGNVKGTMDAGRGVYISALVASLAAALTGCSTTDSRWSTGTDFTQDQKAARATARIDPNGVKGQFTNEFYDKEAAQVELPARWLSEAREATASIEARRAAAQAAQVQVNADFSERTATADADRSSAMSSDQIARAEAAKIQRVYNARLDEMGAQAVARERFIESQAKKNETFLAATLKERQNQFEKMRSQAGAEWQQAQSQHEQMLAQRTSVQNRGVAEIEKMVRVADLTKERASAKASSLRTEAKTVGDQTVARVAELNKQIQTTGEQTGAKVSDLRQRARSLQQESAATVSELRAKAKSLEETGVEETYNLSMKSAETELQRVSADVEQFRRSADALDRSTDAEVQRRRSDANKMFELAAAERETQRAAIERARTSGEAALNVRFAMADRVEADSRAEFVKAEAEARAKAIRETSAHQIALAEDEFKRLRAEAEAMANQIRADVFRTLAEQRKAGSVEMPNKLAPQQPGARSNDPAPVAQAVPAKPPVVDPAHVAKFKTGLSEAVKIRVQAEAERNALAATVEERVNKLEAWFDQQDAAFAAAMAESDGLERQNKAQVAELYTQAEAMFAQAQANFNRSRAEAEAHRKETLATITNLRAEAEASEKRANAFVTQLLAQAESTERAGASEIRRLEVARDAADRRGDARVKQLLAEADALSTSQGAVVAQMEQEIKTARQVLDSELKRLDQAATSFIAISRATYDEATTVADAFARVTQADATEIAASHEAQRRMAQAEVEHMRNLKSSNRLLAEAAVERMLANADMARGQFESTEIERRARIESDAKVAAAAIEAQFKTADAQELAAKAVFDSRIVGTQAERNRAYAMRYTSEQETRARNEQAVAAANAYREMSNQALANLNERTNAFETSAKSNWDRRLAMPSSFARPETVAELDRKARNLLGNPQSNTVVNVPTDGE